ncbi:pyridoxal phosphate-dependent decarboxylase family protein [Ornithinicoccus hortensis]|uniref:Glutamate/tyrosine decarboxylase-like PLP-dependent enzyme n=1 Tax=Ornithinicoccus hortensis TaxID=82346 RepID=A0A542YTR9_9MICO|nr:pyridoxal-dependent decarboxylase [Ornithinicoccus hortensis]TQL51492.1 glutamate/tyrosine decarboxylase-like PLP-dependent enzyme [Ornithinicoccus hortensis]
MQDLHELFRRAADEAAGFRSSLGTRPVQAPVDQARAKELLDVPLPDAPRDPAEVVDHLVSAATPGLMSTPGPRYFGFVVGGALPAASAADLLAVGWDQCAFNGSLSPAAAAAEEVAGGWLKELLGLPETAGVGFVTGAQGANTVGLTSARHHLMRQAGWDVERRGLNGAPAMRVLAGAERHATIDRSLRLLGLGSDCLEEVAVNDEGAIDTADLARVLADGPTGPEHPTVVCLQAGNVNTGAVDDLRAATELAHAEAAWVHVDGAFGLWAAASPALRHLVDGVELADSWGCDGHKWLNVPYDSGFAFCSRPEVQTAAMSYTASYLTGSGASPGAADFTAESSRRARGFAVWAALQELGRDGVADLVDRTCALARRFAAALSDAGLEIVNDVVLNQVLVGFGEDDARTDEILARIQQDGTCWMGGTTWRGRRLMRIAVSNHLTTEADVDASVEAVLRAARHTG